MSIAGDGYFRSRAAEIPLWVDRIADRFEAAWLSGTRPSIADFIAEETGERRARLLDELVRIDQFYRASASQPRTWDHYRAEFPELAQAPIAAAMVSDGFDSADGGDRRADDAADLRMAPPVYVPGYEILDELGRGSMGVVFKARQTALKRTVALKMILAGSFAGPDQRARFRREAEAVARLQNRHIVQIHEVGEHNGLPYCALEYVDGGSLAEKLSGIPQPPRQAAEMIRALAVAVHAAHQHGIVHRDLKPSNVLLTVAGEPKIADFGLAKQLDSQFSYTQTGAAVGTPSYMAPEQAEGRSKDAGAAADVYALSAILYEMLTGRPPFRGASVLETLEQVRSFDLVPPTRLQPKLPRELETICLKGLAREPERRYATAEALADDLSRWLDGRPIQARPQGPAGRLVKWARRRPAVAALVAVVVSAAAAGAGGMWWHTSQLRQALHETEQSREYAESMVYATDLRLASTSYLQGDMFGHQFGRLCQRRVEHSRHPKPRLCADS